MTWSRPVGCAVVAALADLVAVVDFFATRAVIDGFDAPQVACTDLPNEVRTADIIAMTTREVYPVGLHVSIRRQPSTAMTASITVYDAEHQPDDPLGPNPRPCSDST